MSVNHLAKEEMSRRDIWRAGVRTQTEVTPSRMKRRTRTLRLPLAVTLCSG